MIADMADEIAGGVAALSIGRAKTAIGRAKIAGGGAKIADMDAAPAGGVVILGRLLMISGLSCAYEPAQTRSQRLGRSLCGV